VLAVGIAAWLLLSGVALSALAPLALEHEHEHISAPTMAHQAEHHAHADGAIESFSKVFGLNGLDQVTSGWITSTRWIAPAPQLCEAPVLLSVMLLSLTPLPPPGPPPRPFASLVQRGGGMTA